MVRLEDGAALLTCTDALVGVLQRKAPLDDRQRVGFPACGRVPSAPDSGEEVRWS